MLEVSKPVRAVNIGGELQRALPLSSRKDFTDFLEVTPGVTARTFDQGSGGQVYMLRGSEIENHVVQVDGADMGSARQGWAGLHGSERRLHRRHAGEDRRRRRLGAARRWRGDQRVDAVRASS